jgi:hypothetical protein
MRQLSLTTKCILSLALVIALCETPVAEANDFTVGFKAWNASFSASNLDGDSDLFSGAYFSWNLTDRIWISAGYVEGEVDFRIAGSTISGALEEVDSDFVVGWSFATLDVGIGYRYAKFTTRISDSAIPSTSSGPMAFLGGGDLFGKSSWGYYWGLAYMFEDMDDDDGSLEQFNGEGGLRWTSNTNLSILIGYRYKEYSGAGAGGASFGGPVVNLAYTWR